MQFSNCLFLRRYHFQTKLWPYKIKPVSTPPPTSQGALPQKRSESSDNVLTNEFMRVREEKFGKVLQDVEETDKQVEKENAKNLAKSAKMAQNHQQKISNSTVTTSTNCKPRKYLTKVCANY